MLEAPFILIFSQLNNNFKKNIFNFFKSILFFTNISHLFVRVYFVQGGNNENIFQKGNSFFFNYTTAYVYHCL